MELYDYQKNIVSKALETLRKYKMCYLGLEMRLGKTPIAMTIAKEYKSVLFLTTKSALPDVIKMNGIFNSVHNFANYESIHKVPRKHYDLIICDECHKLGKFPRKAIARKNIEYLVSHKTDVVLLSGTPSIESNSQLFHQLTISKHSPFSNYKNFYSWHNDFGIESYVRRHGGMLVKDYKLTKDFSNKYNHLMIRMTREDANFAQHDITIALKYFDLSSHSKRIYQDMKVDGFVRLENGNVVTSNGSPATQLIKLQQIIGGSIIDENLNVNYLDAPKLSYFESISPEERIAVYYKYQGEKTPIENKLLSLGFKDYIVLQIDANNTGIDLSHLDRMIIYSLTFSGSNYAQVLARQAKKDREHKICVDVLLVRESIDSQIYEAVSNKKNFNSNFLRNKHGQRN